MEMKRIVTITFAAHFINDGLIMMIPLLIPFIARDLNLSYTQIGLLGGSLVLTMGVGQFFTGYLSDFSRVKWPFIFLGLVVMSLSLFAMSFSSTYEWLIIFNLLAGLGASFYHPCGVALLAKSMKNKIKGKVLGIHGVGGCIGILVYPLLAGMILARWGWAHVFLFLSPTGIIAAALFFFTGEEPSFFAERKVFKVIHRDSLLMIALFGSIAMLFRGLVTFLPVQLEEIGYTAVSVATVVTIFYGTGVLGEFSAGFLSDMYDRKKLLFTSFLALSVLVLVLFKSVWVFIVPLGFFSYVVWVPVMAVYVEGVPEAWYGTALGILQGLAGLMAFVSPMMMGVIAENVGLSSSFLFLSAIGVMGCILSLKIRSNRQLRELS